MLIRCDVRRMFESLNHGVLDVAGGEVWGWEPRRLWRRERGLAAWLLERWLEAWSPGVGVPTGIAVSPLWANAYMRGVDAAVSAASDVVAFVRYGDDLAILARSDRVLGVVERAVGDARLKLHPDKTNVHRLDIAGDWPARVLGIALVPGAAGGLARLPTAR